MSEIVGKAKRGRPQKLVEYKNVTPNELMWLEIFEDEEDKHEFRLEAQKTVFLSQKDIRNHRNDQRFLEGKIVPVNSEGDIIKTNRASDIMNDEQVKWFVINTKEIIDLINNIAVLKNIGTVERILKEAKKPENNKSYEYVIAIDKRLKQLVRERDTIVYGGSEQEGEE